MPSPLVFVVEDNGLQREVVAVALREASYEVIDCDSVDAATAILDEGRSFSAVVLDVMLGHEIEQTWFLLAKIKSIHPFVPVLMLTEHGSTQIAVKAMKAGVVDFIEKPAESRFTVDELSALLLPKLRAAIRDAESFDRSKYKELLEALSEDQLIDIVLLPLLRLQGFMNVQRNACHGPGELGRDVLPCFKIGDFRERIYYAAAVKAGKVTHQSGRSSSIHTLLDQCKSVLCTTFVDRFDGSRKRVDRCLAVVSGVLTTDARRVFEESTEGRRDVILLEADDIIDLLRELKMLDRFEHAASKALGWKRN